VLDEHNAVWTIVRRAARTETRGPKRLLAELEWRKLRAYEGSLCADVDRVTVVSEDDRVALEQAAGRCLQTMTIPIAIDTHSQPYRPRTADARHILSVATMFYPPNVEAVYWFATQVLPLVRSRMPETQFLIVGSRPPRRIRALAEDPSSGVVVTGYVPDLDPILSQSRVLVVPVASGSGMRVKILEGFARGLPIVSTTIGVEGIEARAGEHLLVADEAPAFA
jgi:glycosyltransferase involved in cell wall biosynthesis